MCTLSNQADREYWPPVAATYVTSAALRHRAVGPPPTGAVAINTVGVVNLPNEVDQASICISWTPPEHSKIIKWINSVSSSFT
jgi:hypothetical protein